MTPEQILRDHLVLIVGKSEPRPNSETTIDPELIEKLIEEIRECGGMGKRMCFYDKEDNIIRDGIPFRSRSDRKKP